MTRIPREAWIEEGFHILADEGDSALTVDALCRRLDRSKGSFYHHFDGRPGYVDALLTEWESQATDRLIETGHTDAPVEDRLRAVNHQASELRNARLERAIRGWSARTGWTADASGSSKNSVASAWGRERRRAAWPASFNWLSWGPNTWTPRWRERSYTGRFGSWILSSTWEVRYDDGKSKA